MAERRPIHVVDLGIGNLGKMLATLHRLGETVVVARQPADLATAAIVVLPGVGAFGDGMASLREMGLVEPIRRHALAGRPLLGICLGMQMLADVSEEYGPHQGLGLIGGRVIRLVSDGPRTRVPNMGWCDVEPTPNADGLFAVDDEDRSFYFAHSYHMTGVAPGDVAATIAFGDTRVVAAIARGAIAGLQFHPELSQDVGLDVLRAFFHRHRAEASPP